MSRHNRDTFMSRGYKTVNQNISVRKLRIKTIYTTLSHANNCFDSNSQLYCFSLYFIKKEVSLCINHEITTSTHESFWGTVVTGYKENQLEST